MLRLVNTNFPAAGKRESSKFPPTLFAHIRDLHVLRFEFFQGRRDVIAHEVEFMLVVVIRIMESGFGRRHSENRPAVAGINGRQLQHITKECPIRFRLLTVDNDMRAVDQAGAPESEEVDLQRSATYTTRSFRRRARPLVTARHFLVSDEVREEICQNAEKSQPRDTVGGKNPGAAAGKVFAGRRLRERLLRSRRGNNRGPIFHAKPPNGRIVAQVHYASRLPGVAARQDYLGQHFTTVLWPANKRNVTAIPGMTCTSVCLEIQISRPGDLKTRVGALAHTPFLRYKRRRPYY